MNYSYVASGSIVLSDSSDSASSNYSVIADGQLVIYDSAIQVIGYHSFVSSGSISINSTSPSVRRIPFVASGSLSISGAALSKSKLSSVGSGNINISYLTSGDVSFNVLYFQEFVFDIFSEIDFSHTFEFDIGLQPLRIFRVVGQEYYNCDNIPFCAIPNGLNRMFQEIVARNISEVCQFLTDVNWTWPIAEIQRSVHPLESFYAVDSTGYALNGELVPTSNDFVTVPFKQIPQCIPFTLTPTSIIPMGISVGIIELIYFVSSGGVSLSGNAHIDKQFVGSGSVFISGSSDCLSAYYPYNGSGNITIDDTAFITFSYYSYESFGSIVLDGESIPISPNHYYSVTGGIDISGSSPELFSVNFVSTGQSDNYPSYAGIVIYGDAVYPISPNVDGKITISGAAICSIIYYAFESMGSISVDGMSVSISPNQNYESSGIISLGGEISIGVASFEIPVDAVPLVFSDSATTRDSISGNFWYTTILSPVSIGGDSDYLVPGYAFEGSGYINLFGTYDSDLTIDDVSMGIYSEIELLEITFNEEFTSNITPVNQLIAITCPDCNPIPDILYFRHNLENSIIFKQFLDTNKLTLPKSLQLSYNRITESWQTSYHFRGIGNRNTNEMWQINFEWSCTSQYGEDDLSSSMWKFSLYVKRIDLDYGSDHDTRLFILFPSSQLCSSFNRNGVDFTFDVHFRPFYVTNEFLVNVDAYNYYDEIGMFKNDYWSANNLICRVLARDLIQEVNITDISSLKPVPPTQFYV